MKRIGLPQVLAAAAAVGLALQPLPAPGRGMEDLQKGVVEETLDNGLKILVLPRRQSPTVSLYMRFKVGAVEEESGATGLAHLLEHMMFKGTSRLGTRNYALEKALRREIDEVAGAMDRERLRAGAADAGRGAELRARLRALQDEARGHVVKDEVDSLYTVNGARGLNASTSADLTTYKVSLPSNRLELWAAIESERLRDPVMREFYSERDVVIEERRQNFEAEPRRRLYSLLLATAYQAHPYGRPIIGWKGDVDYLRASEAEAFFRRWYGPGNAVLAAVGDVDPQAFVALVRKYFGGLPDQPLPLQRLPQEPPQEGERRAVLLMDAEPRLLMAFHKPTLPVREDYVMDLVDAILSGRRTSRLHRRLVEEEQLAVSVSTSNGAPGARFPNLFVVSAVPRHPHGVREVEEAILQELEKLAREDVPAAELKRVRKRLRADMLRGLQSNSGLASMLSYYETVAGDWRYVATHLDILEEVSAEEIRSAAARFFAAKNRSVVTLEKETPAE